MSVKSRVRKPLLKEFDSSILVACIAKRVGAREPRKFKRMGCQWHRTFPHFGPTNFPHPVTRDLIPFRRRWAPFLGGQAGA